jgi:hypothetical protein
VSKLAAMMLEEVPREPAPAMKYSRSAGSVNKLVGDVKVALAGVRGQRSRHNEQYRLMLGCANRIA